MGSYSPGWKFQSGLGPGIVRLWALCTTKPCSYVLLETTIALDTRNVEPIVISFSSSGEIKGLTTRADTTNID